jgi:hypothetical protein
MRKDIVFGLRPVIEAVEAGTEIEKVSLRRDSREIFFTHC